VDRNLRLVGKSRVPGTIQIHGSDGMVAAPLCEPGKFYDGKWVRVRIVKVSKDKDVPLKVREALVGLEIDTIFTVEQIKEQTGNNLSLAPGTRLTYAPVIIEALEQAGKDKEAQIFKKLAPGELDMCEIQPGTYEIVH